MDGYMTGWMGGGWVLNCARLRHAYPQPRPTPVRVALTLTLTLPCAISLNKQYGRPVPAGIVLRSIGSGGGGCEEEGKRLLAQRSQEDIAASTLGRVTGRSVDGSVEMDGWVTMPYQNR